MQISCAKLPSEMDPDNILQSQGPQALAEIIDRAEPWYRWNADYLLSNSPTPVRVREYLNSLTGLDEIELEEAIDYAAELASKKPAVLKKQLRAIEKDGRAETSPANGAQGGRPRNDYHSMTREYVGTRLRDGILTRRFYKGAWRRYTKGRWVELPDQEQAADVTTWLQRNYSDLSETRSVSNILLNLGSTDIGNVASSIELPVWLRPFGDIAGNGDLDYDLTLSPAPNWLPMSNGVLNVLEAVNSIDGEEVILDEKDFMPLTPRLFSLHYLDYDFELEAQCPKFLEYLADVQPDPDGRHMIRCMMGLMLIPETRFNVFFLLQGLAGTGKSVFLHILNKLVGQHNTCTLPLTKFDDDHFTWQLTENLMNSVDDMKEDNLRDVEGTIKVATDGGFLDIRRLYKDGTRAKVIARTVAACNTLPRVHEKSNAIWDRLRVIPFNVVIRDTAKQNKNLKHEIAKEELPGIFIWALAGLAALQDLHIFPEHPVGLRVKDLHRGECDPTAVFLRENYEYRAGDKLTTAEVYGHYKEYAAENGYKQLSAGNFNRDVLRVFPNVEKKKVWIAGAAANGFEHMRRNPDSIQTQQPELEV